MSKAVPDTSTPPAQKDIRTDKQAERLLRSLMTKWSKNLGLWHAWSIDVLIVKDADLNNEGWEPGFETAAECGAHWEYQRAKISFSEAWLRKAPAFEIENTVIHEYQHVILNEIRREHKMVNEERTACVLERAFARLGDVHERVQELEREVKRLRRAAAAPSTEVVAEEQADAA